MPMGRVSTIFVLWRENVVVMAVLCPFPVRVVISRMVGALEGGVGEEEG